MKRVLTFIPLGVGISAAFLYLYNIISFKVINNAVTLNLILSNIRVYLYVSIIGFAVYFLIKLYDILKIKNNVTVDEDFIEEEPAPVTEEPIMLKITKDNNNEIIEDQIRLLTRPTYVSEVSNVKEDIIEEQVPEEKIVINDNCYCYRCGTIINKDDTYCKSCGASLVRGKHNLLRDIINVIEIVIMILVIYFSIVMLCDYKESIDSNFKSPFRIELTK